MRTFTRKIKPFPFIQQPGMMECGTTCLAMIFKYYGYYDIRSLLSEKAGVSVEGIDLYTLSELAESFGFETEGYQLDFENLAELNLPCIAHYEGNHFVVIYKVKDQRIWIADPAVGKMEFTREEFASKWNGVVLHLTPTDSIFKNDELNELVDDRRKQHRNIFHRFYLEPILQSKKRLGQILVATLCLQMLGLALPLFTQTILDQVLVNENIKLLYAILLGMVVIFTSQVVLSFGRNLLLTQFNVAFERSFFSNFFNHFIRLRQQYFDNHKREDFINRFQENLKIRHALNPSILESLIDFLFVLGYIVVLLVYNRTLGFISLSFIVVYVLITLVFTPRLKNLENIIFKENLKTMGEFLDTLLGIQTVRLLGIEKLKYWKWKNQYTRALNKVFKTEKQYIQLSTGLKSIFFAGQAVVYWYGAYLTFRDQLSIGQYVAFITIFTMITNALSRISHLWFVFTELSVTFERLNDVLVQEPIDYNLPAVTQLNTPWQIEFNKVNFKYQNNQERNILDQLSFTLQSGQFVGIVGRNGSGKTTLIKVLSKIYDHYEGSITINQQELHTVPAGYFRKKVAVVPQEVYLFDGTIKENIAYAKPGASDDEIFEAAKMADIHEFIRSQYLGYNVKIGENGIKLSGGERLKIALARVFLTDAEIIILDEASSALDLETEQVIMQGIREKFRNKIIISIAHRINTLKEADSILVLEKGGLAEQGTHQQLLKNKALYHKFVTTYLN